MYDDSLMGLDGSVMGEFSGTSIIMICGILAVLLILIILNIICMIKIYRKVGLQGWEWLIPIYGEVVLFNAVGMSGWNVLLMLVPIVNIVIIIKLLVKLCKKLGHSGAFVLGLIFLSPIFMIILAFSKNKNIEEKNDENEEDVKYLYCPKCGMKLPQNSKACFACGTEVNGELSVNTSGNDLNQGMSLNIPNDNINYPVESNNVTANTFDIESNFEQSAAGQVNNSSQDNIQNEISIPEVNNINNISNNDAQFFEIDNSNSFANNNIDNSYSNKFLTPENNSTDQEIIKDIDMLNNNIDSNSSIDNKEDLNQNVDAIFDFAYEPIASENTSNQQPEVLDLNNSISDIAPETLVLNDNITSNQNNDADLNNTINLEYSNDNLSTNNYNQQNTELLFDNNNQNNIEVLDFENKEQVNNLNTNTNVNAINYKTCPICGSKVVENSSKCVICGSNLS